MHEHTYKHVIHIYKQNKLAIFEINKEILTLPKRLQMLLMLLVPVCTDRNPGLKDM